ncbi:MAG: helix-hairpin-helix domain-containing protein [Candidatus Helarchaeota archaeon]
MALENFLWNGLRDQLNILKCVAKAITQPASVNPMKNVLSLFNVLGVVSQKVAIRQTNLNFKPTAVPIIQNTPAIETVRGIGKKLGTKLRSYGIMTVADLKKYDPKISKIPGISPQRIQKWQNNL